MRTSFTLACLVLSLCFISGVDAQDKKWELGLTGGLSLFQGDLIDSRSGDLGQANLTGGLLVRHHLSPNFALRGNLLFGKLEGDDTVDNDDRPDLMARGFNFNSSYTEAALLLEWDILGGRRYFNADKGHDAANYDNGFRRTFSPYLFVGLGGKFFDLETNYGALTNTTPVITDINEQKDYGSSGLVVPVGGGVKIDLGRNWVLGAELGWRTGFTDYWDGVSESADPDDNDWYVNGLLTLSTRLGGSDSDKDGVADKKDACPNTPGSVELNGCPDADKDGIADKDDDCPNTFGTADLKGCPDTDGDGIADKDDQCPQTAGLGEFGGCPDTDGDGIADKDDACPEVAGLANMAGCPDADGDGIADKDDQCPNEAGLATNKGCPIIDSDGDGVEDDRDDCPDVAGPVNGCPDTDGDGVSDKDDRCPTIAGSAAHDGCPAIEKQDRDLLDFAIKNIRFNTAKATFLQESYAILDQIVGVMQKYPDHKLMIAGYTDSIGSSASNQALSERRAKACYDYLASKGVSKNRMSYAGYGEKAPIADNINEAGRRQNRRVEFSLMIR